MFGVLDRWSRPNKLLLRSNLWNLLLKASPPFNHHMPVWLVFQPLGDKKPETCGAFPEGGSNEAPVGPSDRLDWEYWAVLSVIGNYVTFSIIWLIFERGAFVFILWCFFQHPYQPWHTKRVTFHFRHGLYGCLCCSFSITFLSLPVQVSGSEWLWWENRAASAPSFPLPLSWLSTVFSKFIVNPAGFYHAHPSQQHEGYTHQGDAVIVMPLWRYGHQPVKRCHLTPVVMFLACIPAAGRCFPGASFPWLSSYCCFQFWGVSGTCCSVTCSPCLLSDARLNQFQDVMLHESQHASAHMSVFDAYI